MNHLKNLVQTYNISDSSYNDILKQGNEDTELATNKPEKFLRIDPRNGRKIVYSFARSTRPYDPMPPTPPIGSETCPICQGTTTKIWDVAPLSTGHNTFINENLYPILYPFNIQSWSKDVKNNSDINGMHFLQWLSTDHNAELYNMKPEDIAICLQRLGALEKHLLTQPSPAPIIFAPFRGYVSIIKNYGKRVGSSLEHGHLQIIHTHILPLSIEQDVSFYNKNGYGFSSLLQQNKEENNIIHKENDISVITPFCIKRPLECAIVFHDLKLQYMHQVPDSIWVQVGNALNIISKKIIKLMLQWRREPAFNLLFHTGEIGGMYIEIFPHTQEMGGFEHLGLYTCMTTPEQSTSFFINCPIE